MRRLLLIAVFMLAWLHGAPAAASMQCHEAAKIVATQAPEHHGCCSPLQCAVDCPMHGGALIGMEPAPNARVCVVRASFDAVAPPRAHGWLTVPAHGPPRLAG